MKKHLIKISFLFYSLLITTMAGAQCAYDNTLYLTLAAPAAVGTTVTATQSWGGDLNRITGMQAGFTYEISTCNTPVFDSELTIYPAGGGNAIAHDDDGCGTVGGPSKIVFTPTNSGDYDILLDEYGCFDNATDMDMDIKLVSTGGGGPTVISIPVVVHVVYKNASENITDAQILSQITALNRDFRKQNADFAQVPAVFQPLGADMNIEFCLATVDPNGNPTSGITRTSTTVSSFGQSDDVKSASTGGHNNWDPNHYLNLWSCDLSGNLLGYAAFPSDLATEPQNDGVVIDYAFFGTIGASAPFDLGRTGTHEVGHWLNLRHIWGDANCGDDFVNDTPTQQGPNGGCPAFPTVTCSNGPNGDLFYDYMDYSNDACLLLFTNGQKQRTDATFATLRIGLATSVGCGNTTGIPVLYSEMSFQVFPNPAQHEVNITLGEKYDENVVISFYNVLGAKVKSLDVKGNSDAMIKVNISELPKGIYSVELKGITGSSVKRLVIG